MSQPRIHNKKMLAAIHSVVIEHSGNGELADTVIEYISAGKRKEPTTEAALGVTTAVAAKILAARDALTHYGCGKEREAIGEAYHQLYLIADPTATSRDPWKGLERLLLSSPAPKSEGGSEFTQMESDQNELLVRALSSTINLRATLMTTEYDATTWGKAETKAGQVRKLLEQMVELAARKIRRPSSSDQAIQKALRDLLNHLKEIRRNEPVALQPMAMIREVEDFLSFHSISSSVAENKKESCSECGLIGCHRLNCSEYKKDSGETGGV